MQKIKQASAIWLFILGLFIATRRKYRLPDISVFIPNLNLLNSEKKQPTKQTVWKKVIDSIDLKFISSPKPGWMLSFRPIYGITIPIKMWFPWTAFLAIPQIKYEIGKGVEIKPVKFLGTVVGYRIKFKNIEFWG